MDNSFYIGKMSYCSVSHFGIEEETSEILKNSSSVVLAVLFYEQPVLQLDSDGCVSMSVLVNYISYM